MGILGARRPSGGVPLLQAASSSPEKSPAEPGKPNRRRLGRRSPTRVAREPRSGREAPAVAMHGGADIGQQARLVAAAPPAPRLVTPARKRAPEQPVRPPLKPTRADKPAWPALGRREHPPHGTAGATRRAPIRVVVATGCPPSSSPVAPPPRRRPPKTPPRAARASLPTTRHRRVAPARARERATRLVPPGPVGGALTVAALVGKDRARAPQRVTETPRRRQLQRARRRPVVPVARPSHPGLPAAAAAREAVGPSVQPIDAALRVSSEWCSPSARTATGEFEGGRAVVEAEATGSTPDLHATIATTPSRPLTLGALPSRAASPISPSKTAR